MHNRSPLPLAALFSLCASIFLALPAPGDALPGAVTGTDSIVVRAESLLANYDTVAALQLLNSALETNPGNPDTRLLRGWLYLAANQQQAATEDLDWAARIGSDRHKALAFAGLGHILCRAAQTRDEGLKFLREAIKTDPACFSAVFDPRYLPDFFTLLRDARLADEELCKLLCSDLTYPGAYQTWRNLAVGKKDNEIRDVDKRLEAFLAEHPDSAAWWVDLARDRFNLEGPEKALATLDQLVKANPAYVSADLYLLRARCRLELNDSEGFHLDYWQAMETARKTNQFTRLFRQAETIFHYSAYIPWEGCHTGDERADFLMNFWGTFNPDPLAPYNTRLEEHYRRLRNAEKEVGLQLFYEPYSKGLSYLVSGDTQFIFKHGVREELFRHNAKRERILEPVANGTMNYQDFSQAGKDRGTVFIKNPLKFWFVGNTGNLANLTQKSPVMASRMLQQIQMQYDTDKDIQHSNEFVYSRYRSTEAGHIEIIFYHGVPVSKEIKSAEIGLFDEDWKELQRSESAVYPAFDCNGNRTSLSVHRLDLEPGIYWFGVRATTADGERWVERGLMDLYGFNERRLETSAILLGTLPDKEEYSFSRGGIEMVPRPSSRYKIGELASVFLEIYNLKSDENGARGYTVAVDVTLVEDDTRKEVAFAGGIATSRALDPNKSTTSLNLHFERFPETTEETVTEFFTLDTSLLQPGNYKLSISIKDSNRKSESKSSGILELVE